MDYNDYLSRLEKDKIAVFLFHGVVRSNNHGVRNYNKKHILESDFFSLLKSLKEIGNPITMTDLICRQDLPSNSFIISFDDGFENNYSVAAPILESLNLPSVFYVTSSFVDSNLMSWIDRIEYAIENTSKDIIKLSFLDNSYSLSNFADKKLFLSDIRFFAKNNKIFFDNRDAYISEIFDQCALKEIFSSDSDIDLKLSWQQVREMHQNHLFTIGGHTHTHPIMSYLNPKQLDEEIDVCLGHLKRYGVQDCSHFSYPEGLSNCFDQNVIDALKSRGVICCPTAIDGTNTINSDLFHLKRITVI